MPRRSAGRRTGEPLPSRRTGLPKSTSVFLAEWEAEWKARRRRSNRLSLATTVGALLLVGIAFVWPWHSNRQWASHADAIERALNIAYTQPIVYERKGGAPSQLREARQEFVWVDGQQRPDCTVIVIGPEDDPGAALLRCREAPRPR